MNNVFLMAVLTLCCRQADLSGPGILTVAVDGLIYRPDV